MGTLLHLGFKYDLWITVYSLDSGYHLWFLTVSGRKGIPEVPMGMGLWLLPWDWLLALGSDVCLALSHCLGLGMSFLTGGSDLSPNISDLSGPWSSHLQPNANSWSPQCLSLLRPQTFRILGCQQLKHFPSSLGTQSPNWITW